MSRALWLRVVDLEPPSGKTAPYIPVILEDLAAGPQGPQGDPGPQGPQGPPGSGGNPLDAWPVGSIFISSVSTSPATLLGGGTWARFGQGRVLVSQDSGDSDFDTAAETGGAKAVTLTAAQSGLPQHTHVQDAHSHQSQYRTATTGAVTTHNATTFDTSSTAGQLGAPTTNATAVNQNAGPTDATQSHQNMPPYIVVYIWQRTA